jgi:molybdopterin-guanine dinucleotide biosynthesis protein A
MGRAKAWLPLGKELMLPRVVRLVSEAVQPIVVVGAPDQEMPQLREDVRLVYDRVIGRGPLQGLVDGLDALAGAVDAVFLSSCDAPFLLPTFIRRMIELLGDHAACVARVEGRLHPLAAVYRPQVAPAARQLLAENRLRFTDLFDRIPTRIVDAADLVHVDPAFQSLRNTNVPEEYEAVLRELQKSPKS